MRAERTRAAECGRTPRRPTAPCGRRPAGALLMLVVITGLLVGPALAGPAYAGSAATGPQTEKFDAAFDTPPDVAQREAQLVQSEDQRLIDVRVAGSARQVTYPLVPYQVRTSGLYTLVLPARRAAYTLDDLRKLMPQTFLLQKNGAYLLREHILIDTGATLAIAPTKPTTIRMASDKSGFVSIVSRGGNLRLLGSAVAPLTFTSWNQTDTTTDTDVTDGRAYILAEGQLVARHSNFQDLGFWSGRTGGLALTSTENPGTGVDPSSVDLDDEEGSSSTARQTEVLPPGELPDVDNSIDSISGELNDVTIGGNAFGFFATGASGVNLQNLTITGSLVNGLVLHRSVTSAQVQQVLVKGSRGDGIVITRGVEAAVLSQVTSSDNGRDGIVITGTPLATGPSPSGSPIRQFGNNVVSASLVQNNGRTGIRVVGGTKVRLLGNSISGGIQGVLVSSAADNVQVDANRVANVNGSGIQVRDSTAVEVSGNSITKARTGVHVSDSATAIESNTVSGATLHAISLIGEITKTTIEGNVLAGRGSSAIDTSRMGTNRHNVTQTTNDASGWSNIITKDGVVSRVKHPLTLVWILVALLIIAGRYLLHKHRGPGIRHPYLDVHKRSIDRAAIEADQQRALEGILVSSPSIGGGRHAPLGGTATSTLTAPPAAPSAYGTGHRTGYGRTYDLNHWKTGPDTNPSGLHLPDGDQR